MEEKVLREVVEMVYTTARRGETRPRPPYVDASLCAKDARIINELVLEAKHIIKVAV